MVPVPGARRDERRRAGRGALLPASPGGERGSGAGGARRGGLVGRDRARRGSSRSSRASSRAIQPTIIRARTQALESLGYDPSYRIEIERHPYPVSQTLYYVQGRAGLPGAAGVSEPERPGGARVLARAHAGHRPRACGVRERRCRSRRWRSSPGGTSRTSARATTCGTSCRQARGSRRGSSPRSSCASRSSPWRRISRGR